MKDIAELVLEKEQEIKECPPHHLRIEEAFGQPKVWGECIRGCGYGRFFDTWSDPYEGMETSDLVHDLIFGYTRPGEEHEN